MIAFYVIALTKSYFHQNDSELQEKKSIDEITFQSLYVKHKSGK
jgi:hypothetical protein